MPIVSFAKPPLVEVSFGVLFEPPKGFSAAHYGRFWSEVRSEFEEASDQPPITSPSEVAKLSRWPLPRVWLASVSKRALLQLQPDRFHYNWRRLESSDVYPRFEALAPEFFRWYGLWAAFIDQVGLGELNVRSAELAYVNQIPAGEGWTHLAEVGAIVPAFEQLLKVRPRPTAGGVQAISDAPDCRVQMDARTAKTVTEPTRDLLQIDITAHSKQSVTTAAQLPDWFARANSQIVDSFLSATSTKAQEDLWQRVRE